MNEISNRIKYIFMFITLFLLFQGVVWADDNKINVTPEELLDDIASNYEVCTYREVSSDGAELSVHYAFEFGSELLGDCCDSNGNLFIDGKEYVFSAKYIDSNGQEVYLTRSSSFYDYSFGKIQYINGEVIANTGIIFSLTPKDGSDGEVTVNAGEINVKTNADGEIDPTVKTIETEDKVSGWDVAWSLITGNIKKVGRLITEALSYISIPCGDSFLYMLSSSVGEQVSIDAVVYNRVKKVSIDFFEDIPTTAENTLSSPLKNILHDMVNNFYGIFRNIAILVYIVMLVYIGIKILITSTAQRKSTYKALFMAWVMGVAMLMFFPYVMKYSIMLNNALCEWIASEQEKNSSGGLSGKVAPNAVPAPFSYAVKTFGKDEFVMMMLGKDVKTITDDDVQEFKSTAISSNAFGSNVMMEVRFIAAHKLDLPLAIVYFILIGELLAILILYYKRVFMVAFLISIFPLVIIFYPLSKIGEIKFNCFGVWFKEFLVNVFVQSFHAVTYAVVVTVGVNSYLSSSNWLFMILCVLFLFDGEKIIRGIFNAKSSMNSIGDMAAAAVIAKNITESMTKMIPNFGKGRGSDSSDDAKEKAMKDREKARTARQPGTDTVGAATNLAAGTAAGTGADSSGTVTAGAGGTTPGTGATPAPNVTLDRDIPVNDYAAMNNRFDNTASKSRVGKASSGIANVASGAFSGLAQVTGATVGLTFGMAQADNTGGIDKAMVSAVTGMKVGKEVGTAGRILANGIAGKVSNVYAGAVVAREYMNGEHDDEIGISEANRVADQAKTEAIRKAYARVARMKGTLGNDIAEIQFIKDRLDRDKGK